MMIRMSRTLRAMLVATAASSLLLAACSSSSADDQQRSVSGALRAPANNPNAVGGGSAAPMMQADGLRAPASNPQSAVGAHYQVAPASSPPDSAAQKDEKSGMFSWMWDKKEPNVDTAQRRVPAMNQTASEQINPMATASYEPAAPVAQVNMEPMSADDGREWSVPQKDVIVADEVIVMDEGFMPAAMGSEEGFPSLSSVPPRPERLNAMDEKNARMADLEAARSQSMEQGQQLNSQMASDNASPDDLNAEFAALVASPDQETSGMQNAYMSEEIEVIQEPAPAVVVSQGGAQPWDMPGQAVQQQSMSAPVETVEIKRPAMQNWEPVPMVQPQVAMGQPIQQDEWVSLQQDPATQMAAPVDEVVVSGSPQVASVSAVPVMPAGNVAAMGGAGIQLVPPSSYGTSMRTLPESRYAARRQAVYMQRYARQADGGSY